MLIALNAFDMLQWTDCQLPDGRGVISLDHFYFNRYVYCYTSRVSKTTQRKSTISAILVIYTQFMQCKWPDNSSCHVPTTTTYISNIDEPLSDISYESLQNHPMVVSGLSSPRANSLTILIKDDTSTHRAPANKKDLIIRAT